MSIQWVDHSSGPGPRRGFARKVAALVTLVVVAGGLSVTSAPTGAVASAEPAAGDPIGNLDSISVRMAPWNSTYRYEVFGWAADPNAAGWPLVVHIYLDGVFRQTLWANEPRPDVGAAFAWAGANAGFSMWVGGYGETATDPHVVCAYGINVGAGENSTLGCFGYPGGGDPAGNPRGALDEVVVSPGLVRVRGWAGDPDGGGGPLDVRVYRDGEAVTQFGASDPRPDVPAVFPALGGSTGFERSIPMMPGEHLVCVYAGNIGREGSDNVTLGCADVEVPGVQEPGPGEPLGNLDRFWGGSSWGTVQYVAEGWAFDPDAPAPWRVRLRALVDGYSAPVEVMVDTGRSRPDVERAYPEAGPSTGWAGAFYSGAYGTLRLVCAYAVNVGPGSAPERFLGCRR